MAESDFHVDDPIAVEGESPARPPSENGATPGAQYNKNIPGNEGFYTSGGGSGGAAYNNADQMINMPSDDPGRYLPRANITEAWLKRQIAIRARVQRMYTGFENPMDGMWWYIAGSVAIDGMARKQFVIISTGDRQVDIAGRSGGWFSNIGSRLLGNQNNKLNNE